MVTAWLASPPAPLQNVNTERCVHVLERGEIQTVLLPSPDDAREVRVSGARGFSARSRRSVVRRGAGGEAE